VIINVDRSFLEINSIEKLNRSKSPGPNFKINQVDPPDFQLNKFFYKQIGKKYRWIDRLAWGDKKWIEYVENPRVKTFVLKENNNLVGFYETVRDFDSDHSEIAYFGILEEYFGKKCGGYLLSEAIKKLFEDGISRVWLHTCSLDHKNAIKNYLARGMQIFKSEKINVDVN
jgi:ribosomal protein S18 acetylase RimI-like enzyme